MPWARIAPQLAGTSDLVIEPFTGDTDVLANVDLAFLALPHEASAELAPKLLAQGNCRSSTFPVLTALLMPIYLPKPTDLFIHFLACLRKRLIV